MDYDNDTKRLDIFMSGKENCTTFVVRPAPCRTNCPDPTKDCAVDKVVRKWSDVANWKSGALPAEGEDVVVECPWTMLLDVAETPVFKSLTIVGTLMFDKAQSHTKLKSKSIYVKGGVLKAGEANAPFTQKITIEIHGERTNPTVLVDDHVDGGNKNLIVTGTMSLYGATPAVTMTRLADYADKGASSLTVTDNVDWKVGDTIVVTATGSSYFEDEYRNISAVSGNTLSLTEALAFDHYGAAQRLNSSVNGEIDMRGSVGLMTRNIEIIGAGNDHGVTVIVATSRLKDPATKELKMKMGAINATGVQFTAGGQANTKLAALNFQYTEVSKWNPASKVTGCSFHQTRGMCVYLSNSRNVTINNNVVTRCQKYGISIWENNDIVHVNNNLVAGVSMWGATRAM